MRLLRCGSRAEHVQEGKRTSQLVTSAHGLSRFRSVPLLAGTALSVLAYCVARFLTSPAWFHQVAAVLWLLGLGIVLLRWTSPRRAMHRLRLLLADRQLVIHCLALFLLALLMRAVALDRIPANLGGDEFSQALEAKAFWEGRLNAVFGTSDWYRVPLLYPWLGSLIFRLLGPAPWVWRLFTAVAGSLTVPLLYLLVRVQFRSVTLALAAGGLLAFHHVHVLFSRLGSNQGFDGLFVTALFLAILLGRRDAIAAERLGPLEAGASAQDRRAGGSAMWWYVAGAVAGLGFYFYFSLRGIAAVGLAIVILLALMREAPRLRGPVWYVVGIALAVFPLVGGAVRSGHELNRRVGQVLAVPEGEAIGVARELLTRSDTALQSLQGLGLRGWYESGAGLLVSTLELLLLFVGVVIAVRRVRDAGWIHPLLLAAVFGSVALLTENPVASQRITSATIPAAVLIALGLGHLARLLWPKRRADLVLATVALIAGINTYHLFFYHLPRRSVDTTGLVATELASWLDDNPDISRLMFCGEPQMQWDSNSSLPYRHPHVQGVDLDDKWKLTHDPAIPGTAYVTLKVCEDLRYGLSLQSTMIGHELRYQKADAVNPLDLYLDTGGRGYLRWLPVDPPEPYRPQEELVMTVFTSRAESSR